ncbi:hypothetical protein [Amycolatopsis australiensis]|uniref:Uncharacterized protein n=1 Tax=Amycolatopsis australiensis TaxID=546364 RepID=A0A1K1PP50_9PSEU|nr:hypothetical protein [Amycolatopsis australiensis]SFW49297.1 hypothetical protein SAMN04489730_0840 [Amycolatopsis australiensis]
MRIRIALTLGALVLAGGALTGGIALASEAQPPAPSATTSRPSEPTVAPAPGRTTQRPAPSATPAPRETTRPAQAAPRVPRAVPAGPTGDLHLPAIGVTR